jgi:Right handed beta helix region
MRWILVIMLLTGSYNALASTYYVSSSSGSDANSGTSTTAAWQTIAHVNLQTFLAGDSVLFKRGDVWNESLAPATSGSSGNPITFDAYGTGAAPNLTGYYAVPAGAWVLVTGNAWKAPVPATYSTINFCLFGSIWGQKVAASSSNLTAQWDFYLANGFVYVYSIGSPATFYGGPIVPMALSNVPVININGKSWLTFQHFMVNWFDEYGIYVQGASDHLVFANMEADSMIPQGTQPLGFYVNETAPGPGDIKIYNTEAHLNYDGFRFDGAATAIAMINDKAYGNRDGALVDNTSAVNYSYCHFYASSLAVAGSTDVTWTIGTGPTAGVGNVAVDTAPAVQVWQRYPAEITLTVDDAGMTAGADTYYANTVLPIADAASIPVGAAVTVGYPLAQTLVAEFQGWVNAGRDVTSHSMSHTYYTNTDGLSLKFYLSQKPFAQAKPALIDEEYRGPVPDPTTWIVNDPSAAVSVVAQTLQVAGGNGVDGQTTVSFIEQIELGGAVELQHGDVSFTAPSQGVLGGLYAGGITEANCLAGFQISPSGGQSSIQALMSGSATGPVVTTTAGHRYVLTTYLYSTEVYRAQERFHSSAHPAGSGWGGAAVTADVRLVLEVQDIDPNNPATLVAPATVLYDGVLANAAAFCTYALVDAINMQCGLAYTYAAHISLAEVRTALPNANYVTQLVGALSDGAECGIASATSLDFYPSYVPALNELIVVRYRGHGQAVATVQNAASVAAMENGSDDGTRGTVLVAKTPAARTDVDCENAALSILDDAAGISWMGTYEVWSDFLPGAAGDIFPGDSIAVNVPSRGAVFSAIVRDVEIEIADAVDDRSFYTIVFANDLAVPLAMEYQPGAKIIPLQDVPALQDTTQVGAYYQADLTEAQITAVTSTTVQVDAGMAPASGYGIEVREHDYGWGQANDRNLLGRFSTQAFSLPRLARTQNYFLRLYDGSSPPRYSRHAAALHVDYPL